VHFPNRSVTIGHLGHFIIGTGWPEDFDLLSLGVRHDLTADVGLVGLIEYIDSHVDDHVRVINLFVRRESELLDTESLTTSQSWHASQELFNVGRLHGVVPGSAHLPVELLDIFHGPGAIVCWDGATLSHGVDVTHIVDRRRRVRVERLDVSVDILSRGQLFGHEMRFIV